MTQVYQKYFFFFEKMVKNAWIFDLSSFNLKPNICSKILFRQIAKKIHVGPCHQQQEEIRPLKIQRIEPI